MNGRYDNNSTPREPSKENMSALSVWTTFLTNCFQLLIFCILINYARMNENDDIGKNNHEQKITQIEKKRNAAIGAWQGEEKKNNRWPGVI